MTAQTIPKEGKEQKQTVKPKQVKRKKTTFKVKQEVANKQRTINDPWRQALMTETRAQGGHKHKESNKYNREQNTTSTCRSPM